MNDESLLNEKGLELMRQRDIWRAVLAAFNPEERTRAIAALEDLMEFKLNES